MKLRYRLYFVPLALVILSLMVVFNAVASKPALISDASGNLADSHSVPDFKEQDSLFQESISEPSGLVSPENDIVFFDPIPWVSADNNYTQSVAWGDVDGDGDLDLAVGNSDQASKVYMNIGGVLQTTASWFSADVDDTRSVAWGDVDRDGDLDLAVGNSLAPNKIYLNLGDTLESTASWISADSDATVSIAWGDVDGDGYLDLAAGNSLVEQPNKVYLNMGGALQSTAAWVSADNDSTNSVAWGDMDGDGDLDLAVGNHSQPNKVYLNIGGALQSSAGWVSAEVNNTDSVAWGDMDGDGDLDLVTGNGGNNKVYLNIGGMLQTSAAWISVDGGARSIALGDIDGDSDLDLAAGHLNNLKVYLNIEGILQTSAVWASVDSNYTLSVAWGDMDGDGDLDLARGNSASQQNKVYINVGSLLQTSSAWVSTNEDATANIAWGDIDGDGDLDLAVGNWYEPNKIYINVDGVLQTNPVWVSADSDATQTIAWGDVDNDGDLDLAVGNSGIDRLYLNNNGILTVNSVWSSANSDSTSSIVWGDMDSDGDLDLATGNINVPSKVYLNVDGMLQSVPSWESTDSNFTRSIAWGDVDGDGDLDLAVGNEDQPNKIYLNINGMLHTSASWVSAVIDFTQTVAWGDMNGDGALDLAIGNWGQPSKVYLNVDGTLETIPSWISNESDKTVSVTWGDVDNDGDLDLATGTYDNTQFNKVYLNNGQVLQTSASWLSQESDYTYSVAWGDVDNDGDLDLAEGNYYGPIKIYNNNLHETSGLSNHPLQAMATKPGEVAVANFYHTPQILDSSTLPITYTLFDPEGDPIRMIRAFYSLDGGGKWITATATSDTITENLTTTIGQGIALHFDGVNDRVDVPNASSLNTTGDLTLEAWVKLSDTNPDQKIVGKSNSVNGYLLGVINGQLYPEIWASNGARYSFTAGDIPANQWTHLAVTWDQGGQMTGYINGKPVMSIAAGANPRSINGEGLRMGAAPWNPNTLRANGEIDEVRVYDRALSEAEIRANMTQTVPGDDPGLAAYWRLDEGTGIVAYDQTTNNNDGTLINGPKWTRGVAYPIPHVFTWDTFASDFFGQSDNVVFRIEAYPSLTTQPNGTPVFMYPYASSTTFPFRVRGTQVRVFDETISENNVVQDALVYRLPAGQAGSGFPLVNGAGTPFHTDQNGYLQGRGQIGEGDTLFALWPITATQTYTMNYTNLVPSLSGADGFVVTDPGVQNIAVSSAYPLILYNLDLSLEWDARNDPIYLAQLQADLRLTSENLFDWTNGQAALGQIRIFHAKEHWNDADIRIYATNSLRPHAAVGGWVPEVLTETVTLNATDVITYAPGQVHIGAVWNSYGDPVGNLGDDWPRALAHELGHYLFFLDDNYLGLDASGYLISLSGCPGAMTDPYRNDDASGYDEFHPLEDWEEECADTLSNQETGRADWETLTRFFPWLMQPTVPCPNDTCFGPNGLPLAVSQFQIINPVTPTTTLEAPTFFLFNVTGGMYQNSTQARAYLLHDDQLTDLGQPVSGQLTARGASPGDRLCVYDLPNQAQGCETISASNDQLVMTTFSNWQPDVRITPVTSVTHSLKVTAFDVSAPVLYARLYPLDSAPPVTITLNLASPGVYVSSYENLPEPVLEGYLHVWVDEAEPRREIITDFSIGGDPGPRRSGGSGLAPVLSPDGQVILYGENLNFTHGEFYFLQSATILPQEVPWANIISKGYYLAGSQNAPPLNQTSFWFAYADGAVPPLQEPFIKVYFWGGNSWVPLATQVDTTRNSAVAKTSGPGLYVLMSSYEQSIEMDHPDWTPFFFPYTTPQAVGEALASIAGSYTSVCYKQTTDSSNPWRCYGAGAPNWSNDLKNLEAKSYLIYLKESVVIRYKGSPTMAIPPDAPADFLIPPAVFYGIVGEINGIQPYEGIPIYALVKGTSCGQAETTEWSGQIVYVIDVYAEDFGTHFGCGTPDSPFTLQALGYVKDVIWDHTEFHNVLLGIGKWFLPLIFR